MEPCILLLDNGSLEPAATLALREVALELGTHIGQNVEPVSALHSNVIPAAELDGRPAEVLEEALEQRIAAGKRDFVILPLFFGQSGLLTEYTPKVLRRVTQKYPGIAVRVGAPLVDPSDPSDRRIASALASRVRTHLTGQAIKPVVILVDHGSPSRAVSAVRDFTARQLGELLGDSVSTVLPASMERRPGPEYDFNDPLLAAAFDLPSFHSGTVIVALLFLAPGRHAGPGGDIARMCLEAEARHPGLRVLRTEPIGTDPVVIEILANRARSVL